METERDDTADSSASRWTSTFLPAQDRGQRSSQDEEINVVGRIELVTSDGPPSPQTLREWGQALTLTVDRGGGLSSASSSGSSPEFHIAPP